MELTLTGGDEPAGGGVKTSEPDPETPLRIRPAINGVLKRHLSPPVAYRDCLKNHAATLGGYAVDGCGEFMPSPTATSSDPTSLKCAACGCHRNFHRREPEDAPAVSHVLDYQPHHRHHPPRARSPGSPSRASPPPSHYPSAPHMLLALTSDSGLHAPPDPGQNCRKRFRTKFSSAQKEKMLDFAERIGWKMQRRDDEIVTRFCSEVGVDRGVLKVWMHNNKNTFSKRDFNGGRSISIATPNPEEEDDPQMESSDPRIPTNAASDCFSSRLEE